MDQKEQKINVKGVNEIIKLSKKLLKLLYVIIVIVGVVAVIQICRELGIISFVRSILKILSPLFIGLIIAWIFNPLVRKLERKGIRRALGTTLIYLVFIGLIVLILFTLIPSLTEQIQELVKQIPAIGDSIQKWISEVFAKFNIEGIDVEAIKLSLITKIEAFGTSLAESLPEYTVKIVSSIFASLGTFLIALIIGFYALLGFDHPTEAIKDFLPKRMHKNFEGVATNVNDACRSFINGALIDCFLVFLVSSLGLWIIGLKSPLLFGLFCGITNIIPYAGPYIGGAPAVIVGLTQNPVTGILALVVISIIQALEGNIFQPMIMSKTTKLHPITIILGLLIFGYFWGIIGMIIATPVIAAAKSIIVYFDEKYDILNFN